MRIEIQNSINYKAKLVSQWNCLDAQNKIKNISIVSLDKRDLLFAEKFVKYAEEMEHIDSASKEVLNSSAKSMLEILKFPAQLLEKIKIFIATYDKKPCGLCISNIPKFANGKESLVYSSRHNLAKNETEIDWLVTWADKEQGKINGIGKALVGEYFRTVNEDGFRDVFVRSEIPEKSYASSFYENLGFEFLTEKRLKLSNKNSAQYIINDYGNSSDYVIPMLITKTRLLGVAESLADKMCREEYSENSYKAEALIKI